MGASQQHLLLLVKCALLKNRSALLRLINLDLSDLNTFSGFDQDYKFLKAGNTVHVQRLQTGLSIVLLFSPTLLFSINVSFSPFYLLHKFIFKMVSCTYIFSTHKNKYRNIYSFLGIFLKNLVTEI